MNGILQGIGKVNFPVISAGTALVLHVLLLIPLVKFTNLGVYALIFATAIYAIIIVIMNMIAVKKYLGFKMDWKQVIGIPLFSAIIMGVIAGVVYKGVVIVVSMMMGAYLSNAVATLVAVIIAVFTYFIAMIKIGGYTKEMLEAFPKGALLARIAQKLHLIKA